MGRNLADKKSLVREKYIEVRKSLLADQVEQKSEMIQEKLFKLPEFIGANVVHTYVSMSNVNEVSTRGIIQYCFDQQKKIVVPKMEKEGILSHHLIDSFEDLETNEWGVDEPKKENPFPLDEFSIILVPMVSTDQLKNRLGYGMGFYDRFLSKVNTFNVGLAFDCQLSENTLPVEPFDKKMDVVITESKNLS
ncbi:MAG: 5-formyltetrahydrofolate cyclo-ligase [Balneolaceae bacterium]